MKDRQPIYVVGEGAFRVAVSKSVTKKGAISYTVYGPRARRDKCCGSDPDGKRALGGRKVIRRLKEDEAIKEADFLSASLKSGVADDPAMIPVTRQEVQDVRDSKLALAGTGLTLMDAVGLAVRLTARTPAGATVDNVFHNGLKMDWAEPVLDVEFLDVLSVIGDWLEKNSRGADAWRNSFGVLEKYGKFTQGIPTRFHRSSHVMEFLNKYENAGTYNGRLGMLAAAWRVLRAKGFFPSTVPLPTDNALAMSMSESDDNPEGYPWEAVLLILSKTPEPLRDSFYLQTFGFCRPEESYYLEYEQVTRYYVENWFLMPKEAAKRFSKSNAKRWVPISPALKAHLQDIREKSGPIAPAFKTVKHFNKASNDAIHAALEGSPYLFIPDGLRKACITFTRALGVSIGTTADVAGTSEKIIKKYYENVSVTRPDALNFFSITTPGSGPIPDILPWIHGLTARPNSTLAEFSVCSRREKAETEVKAKWIKGKKFKSALAIA